MESLLPTLQHSFHEIKESMYQFIDSHEEICLDFLLQVSSGSINAPFLNNTG